MIHRNPNYNPGPYNDDWEDIPAGGPAVTWGVGLLLASVLAFYGLGAILTRQFDYESERIVEHLRGARAVAVGLAFTGGGLLLFCHYFLQNWRPMAWYAVLGKITGLLLIIGGLGVYIVRWFIG